MPSTITPDRPAAPPADPIAGVAGADLTVSQLEAAIRHHNHLYFVAHAPVIDDYAFDRLVERLRALSPESPVLAEIGSDVTEGEGALGDKVVHKRPMLSLDKCYDEAGLRNWAKDLPKASARPASGQPDLFAVAPLDDDDPSLLVATPKIDGLACSIHYGPGGALMLAATRGDGTKGDNITQNVRQIPNVPGRIEAPGAEVRGEVYLPLTFFRTVADRFANPRNTAAGTLKQKEGGEIPPEALRFQAYDLLDEGAAHKPRSEWQKLQRLQALGFAPPEAVLCRVDDACAVYERFVATRGDLDVETDGVVFKTNSIAAQERLGMTAHHPRWAIAYKYQGESAETTLADVEWSVSRTGVITPVAIVAPVVLSGATVTRASLHNLSILRKIGGDAGLRLGDTVVAMRRGGVIPHLEASRGGGHTPVEIPATCPSCERVTVEREEFLFCSAPGECTHARVGAIIHFVATVEIEGLGQTWIEQLYDAKLLDTPASVYTLTVAKLLPFPRMGETLAAKIAAQIDAHRTVELPVFLRALGVRDLGKGVADSLAQRFTLDEILAWQPGAVAELSVIHGIGDKIAANVIAGLHARRAEIDRLLEHVTVIAPQKKAVIEGSPLAGKKVVFTGSLKRMTRRDAQALAGRLGGETPGSVSGETDILVVGDDELHAEPPSSKLKSARKHQAAGRPIEILTEDAFWERVAALV